MYSTPLRLHVCFDGVNRAFTEVATFVCFTVPSVSQCTLSSLFVTAHLLVSSFTLVFLVFYTLRGKSLLISLNLIKGGYSDLLRRARGLPT